MNEGNMQKTFIHESKVYKIGKTLMTNHMYGVLCAIPKIWDRSVICDFQIEKSVSIG